jgi:endonuclease/exonuclease/phosphatase family metal-dependent hydrolase
MTTKTRAVSLALLACAVSTLALGQEPRTFTIATWNLEWFYDESTGDNYSDVAKERSAPNRTAWDWKRDAVAASITAMNPDLIAFQEIEDGRVLGYLSKSIERLNQRQYRVAFIEGTDSFTEQDVGFLFRGIDVLRQSRNDQSQAMFRSGSYYNVSKHLELEVIVDPEGVAEPVTVVTIHLRAKSEEAEIRTRQTRLLRYWLDQRLRAGANVIVLGDTNSEEAAEAISANSDLGVLCGLNTEDTADDLVDLHSRIPRDNRQTHLLSGKQYDRILVSRSLLDDAPGKTDLVLQDAGVRRELTIRGTGPDEAEKHWQEYWKLSDQERDLSDHYPVVATFRLQ